MLLLPRDPRGGSTKELLNFLATLKQFDEKLEFSK